MARRTVLLALVAVVATSAPTDVADGSWADDALDWAEERGIVLGLG